MYDMDSESKPRRSPKGPGRPDKGPVSRLTLRLPTDILADLAAVAKARGVDVTSVAIQTLAEARPGLLRWLREHTAALAESNGQEAEKA
jgi:post-segregation antitoxin (ccd killing protein)